MKAALEVAYPAWLSAPQIEAICIELAPRYAGDRHNLTARTLGRLHSYRQVDRIGEPNWVAKGNTLAAAPGAGYRFRLRREAEDML